MSIHDDIFNNLNSQFTARYGWQGDIDEELYTFGYIDSFKSNADSLVEQGIPDINIFPIMVSYRQYLELVLKNICYRNMSKSDYQQLVKKASHNLITVWNCAVEVLKGIKTPEQISVINEVITIFDTLDPNSFTFRYEFDKGLNRAIKPDRLEINTYQLRKWMDIVDLYLRDTYDSV